MAQFGIVRPHYVFMQNTQSWFTSKFTKLELDGKSVAFMLPNEARGKIGKFHVRENAEGKLWIEIHYGGVTREGMIEAGKMAIAQDWIDKIARNLDTKIPADFIIL